jgi:hypothetical protein
MNTCGTCKHRGEELEEFDDDYKPISVGYFMCDRMKLRDQHDDRSKGQGAFVIDGSGYFAALCVEDDFGCNKWEAK